MGTPRKATLVERIYSGIEENTCLNSIYDDLLYNYTVSLFGLGITKKTPDLISALRFADLLSKSVYMENSEKHHVFAQELAILLNQQYSQRPEVLQCLKNVLAEVGNYRGLDSITGEDHNLDFWDSVYYAYDRDTLRIPGKEDSFFLHSQKEVYDGLERQFLSYSGPTSMGKSFLVQTYIIEQIKKGVKKNFCILVPTKALINEVRKSFLNELKGQLQESNYRVVTAAGDIVLQQEHNFIFVMTPERMLYLLIAMPDLQIDFAFIDEAHRISSFESRSIYYYKVIDQIYHRDNSSIVFASPNIPNPEIYLNLIPGFKNNTIASDNCKFASKYTPVCQFKFMADLLENQLYYHNPLNNELKKIAGLGNNDLNSLISLANNNDRQSLVYCNATRKVLDYALEYADHCDPIENDDLIALSKDIRKEVHNDCFLADLVLKGIAYHVGYLPATIRLRIEEAFEAKIIKTIFCTSTLIEGVNLPADNLFITSYQNGPKNMDNVEFRNLVGRVGRFKYNLYGNVILVRMEEKTNPSKYQDLLQNDVPKQSLAYDNGLTPVQKKNIVAALSAGDALMQNCYENETKNDYAAMRKVAMILTKDLVDGKTTTTTEAFKEVLTSDITASIVSHFSGKRTNDDIALSYDQAESLQDAIANGLEYPAIQNDWIDPNQLYDFLVRLRGIFKWQIYESKDIGKKGTAVLSYYATILSQWIRGMRLNSIIEGTLEYKEAHPYSGVWINNNKVFDEFDPTSKLHKNYVMADTLGSIENVILFSLSNYFRKISIAYKEYHNVDHFDNDWYEYIEYGTTNKMTMLLQQSGFSRDSATYILERKAKYVLKADDDQIILSTKLFDCNNNDVVTEAKDIQYNLPELFSDPENKKASDLDA